MPVHHPSLPVPRPGAHPVLHDEAARPPRPGRAAPAAWSFVLAALTALTASPGCVDASIDSSEDERDDEPSTAAQPILPLPLRRTFTGDSGGSDRCNAITAGPNDTMIVTGEVRRIVQGYNAWSRAYDATGATSWTREINTPSEGMDRGNDVVALPDGTSVIAGSWFTSSSTQRNHFLTKTSPTGAQVWWNEGSLVGDDVYLGVARDSTGAWIATGSRPDAGGVARAWIRKLSADGSAETWSILRNGTAAGVDAANKIAVDSNDDIIVVGREHNSGTGLDGWIAKYDLAGALQWNLSVASAGPVTDEIVDVAVASNDGIAVVGKLDTSSTIRTYTFAGTPKWDVTAADGITWRAVATDAADNVLVTGSQGPKLIVRKYTNTGTLLWQQTWPGAQGHGIAADSLGRVLVCGAENTPGGGTDGLVLRYLP